MITGDLIALIVGGTAELLIYISADEFIPAACQGEVGHRTIFSLMAGELLVIVRGGI